MVSLKLKGLLLLLVIGGTIQSFGQTDSSKICLTNPEFDFYAQSVIEREGLRGDTAILLKEIYYLNGIIDYNDKKVADYKEIIVNKDFSILEKDDAFDDLSKDYQKSQKKHKRMKQLATTLGIVAGVLGIILVLK